jgi:hypothetical protein
LFKGKNLAIVREKIMKRIMKEADFAVSLEFFAPPIISNIGKSCNKRK